MPAARRPATSARRRPTWPASQASRWVSATRATPIATRRASESARACGVWSSRSATAAYVAGVPPPSLWSWASTGAGVSARATTTALALATVPIAPRRHVAQVEQRCRPDRRTGRRRRSRGPGSGGWSRRCRRRWPRASGRAWSARPAARRPGRRPGQCRVLGHRGTTYCRGAGCLPADTVSRSKAAPLRSTEITEHPTAQCPRAPVVEPGWVTCTRAVRG